jgi:hypothetical protein
MHQRLGPSFAKVTARINDQIKKLCKKMRDVGWTIAEISFKCPVVRSQKAPNCGPCSGKPSTHVLFIVTFLGTISERYYLVGPQRWGKSCPPILFDGEAWDG